MKRQKKYRRRLTRCETVANRAGGITLEYNIHIYIYIPVFKELVKCMIIKIVQSFTCK